MTGSFLVGWHCFRLYTTAANAAPMIIAAIMTSRAPIILSKFNHITQLCTNSMWNTAVLEKIINSRHLPHILRVQLLSSSQSQSPSSELGGKILHHQHPPHFQMPLPERQGLYLLQASSQAQTSALTHKMKFSIKIPSSPHSQN